VAPTSASDIWSYGDSQELRRAVVVLAVVAAHVALILVIGRGARPVAEVVEVVFFPLPIMSEGSAHQPLAADEPKLARASASTRSRGKPRPQEPPRNEAASDASAPDISAADVPASDTFVPGTSGAASSAPAARIDWYAEARASAGVLEQRDRNARDRRSLAGPAQPPMAGPRHGKPACPFEKCEPTYGTGFSIFESQNTKAGRIEKTPDGEVIRWTSNRCFQILITPNLMHRGMTKCVMPLKKSAPRGDLFKHMNEVPPPAERATDVP
jgi:hypothetical protein